MALLYESISETGLVREVNQDRVFADIRGDIGIFVVADGMGGHSKGEMASSYVVELIESWWKREYIMLSKIDFADSVKEIEMFVQQMNEVICAAYEKEDIKGGTTISILFVRANQYAVMTVGDSRVFVKRKRNFMQISVDDVWENLPENVNVPTRELIKDRRYGTLTQALGYDKQIVMRIDIQRITSEEVFILCSDGVYKYIDCRNMRKLLVKNLKKKSIKEILEIIKCEVNVAGAGDNFSCILVKV